MKRSQRAPVVMPSELIRVDHPFYNSPTVHKEMLDDKVRTLAFKESLKKVIKKGNVVFDIGTGTGILSMFAAKIGARRVYASDSEEGMYKAARKIIQSNKLGKKIKVLCYKGEKIRIPEKVDVVVSECLGHFGFDEGMIKAVSESKYLLKKNGKFIPSCVRLFIAATSDDYVYKKYIDVWKKKLYGFDFDYMKQKALERIYIKTFSPKSIISDPLVIISYNLGDSIDTIRGGGIINISEDSSVYGLVGWFEADLADGIIVSSSPFSLPTHWEQSFLPTQHPFNVKKGDKIKVDLCVKSSSKSPVYVEFLWNVKHIGKNHATSINFGSKAII